jgi:hypothetical protein
MKSKTTTTITTRMVEEEIKSLVITFTAEEVEYLINLGKTSHVDRVAMLGKYNHKSPNDEKTSSLMAELYFAASAFKRSETEKSL